ncbi:uncharacterized protein L3040_002919 [Drepanopeziza brunnea f. sp. 'multigermtubi']|uniref:Uncharacterized protein n=1 Tax=Marssonina brunnea f. sp. multigermtubi (strain MB_m1) TaxID=1072389 RepID=K1XL13_MARBU|nr:uncharacterized protein MBM_08562 [Drepanopeziza brunnea f. sp. 'multigermtubi' MB_m1]EKD13119.1 hypothetical protein MBM_08562 [Drepanopeziza brunnea f. sp. 'multigermtubi' MB_m1]KAJ5047076.1 hypothetical protein L3040_002919 [Drepanopeziza brunnea f. sp. 'multigermtubi']
MLLLSQFLCPSLLAVSSLLTRAQAAGEGRKTIAYRTVSQAEAEAINQRNKPSRDESYDAVLKVIGQLGSGFYTTNKPSSWEVEPGKWYCVIEAPHEKIENYPKIWIPEYWERPVSGEFDEYIDLWERDESVLLEYIATKTSKPKKALRFSYVAWWHETLLQMVIPTITLESNELDLWAKCFPTTKELEEYSSETIDWTSWENIIGEPGYPPALLPNSFD